MDRSTADSELVAAAIRGERTAFATLVERYHPMVCAVSYAATGDRALSEDVAQDAFIAAWSGLGELRDAGRLRPWLCGIARNIGHKALRKSGRETLVEPAEAESIGDDNSTALDAMIDAESEQLVWSALRQLPDKNREAMVLYYRDGESASEVAAALGISEAAVMQRLSRGRQQLKKRVSAIVERSLKKARPSAGVVATVVAALPALGGSGHAAAAATSPAATPTTHGGTAMIKIGLITAVTAAIAGGGIWYATHDGEGSDALAGTEVDRTTQTTPAAAPTPPHLEGAGLAAAPAASARTRGGAGGAPDWITTLQLPGELNESDVEGHRSYLDCARQHIGNAGDLTIDIDADDGKVASIALAETSETKRLSPAAMSCLSAIFVGKPISGGAEDLQARFSWRDDHQVPEQPDRDLMKALDVEDGASRGPASAPVTLVVFHDFACRFCAKVLGTIDELFDDYPNKLRLVLKQYPVHPRAKLAHEAVLAAGDQGKLWPMHDRIMAARDDLSEKALIAHARHIGLDVARFRRDLREHTFAGAVQADIDQGVSMGVRGTPTFLINGKRVVGARPVEFFRAEIDAALR